MCFSVLFFACNNGQNNASIKELDMEIKKTNEENLNIMVTDKILYFMAKDIVGDKHFVQYMFKNKKEEFDFVYSEDSLNNIAKQDLFIYNGAGLEPWINDFLNKLNKNNVGTINVSRGVNLLIYNKEVKYKNLILKENPYYWINIDNYKIALLNIKNSIQDRDPRNRDIYEKNFSDKLKELETYEKKFKELGNKFKNYSIFYLDEDLEYFIKYSGIKANKLVESKEFKDVDEKINGNKNIVFLYTNEEELKKNDNFIKKYHPKLLKITIYKENTDYINILKQNMIRIENMLKS